MDSQVSNHVTTSDVERFYEMSEYVNYNRRVHTTVLTHLDKRSFGANTIQCLCQGLVILADILVLKESQHAESVDDAHEEHVP